MAVKFKSKYTGPEIEAILDSVKTLSSNYIISVDELPPVDQAQTGVLYNCKDKIYFSTGEKWVEVNTDIDSEEGDIDGDISIKDDEGNTQIISAIIDFADFVQYGDLYFSLPSDSQTGMYLHALRELMKTQGKTHYSLSDVQVINFIEDLEENNMLTAIAADNHGHFFVKIDLIDGHEVDITLEETLEDGTELYLIEYVGYAL